MTPCGYQCFGGKHIPQFQSRNNTISVWLTSTPKDGGSRFSEMVTVWVSLCQNLKSHTHILICSALVVHQFIQLSL
jgi:hypothetical protein